MDKKDIGFDISSDYYEKAQIFTAKPEVLVWVESNDDKRLWINVFDEFNDKYIFRFFCASDHEFDDGKVADGCCRVFKLIRTGNIKLGKYCIACLDSDFSFVSGNYESKGKSILQNDFVYETFVHSKENVFLNNSNINAFLSRVIGEKMEQININLDDIYRVISKAVYDVFVNLLCFYRQGDIETFDLKMQEFNGGLISVVNSMRFEDLLDNCFSENISPFVNEYNEKLKKDGFFINYLNDLENVKGYFGSVGISEENAYLFMRGHNFNSLMVSIFKKIEKHVFSEKIRRYDQSGMSVEQIRCKKKELAGKRPDIESSLLGRGYTLEIPFFMRTVSFFRQAYD